MTNHRRYTSSRPVSDLKPPPTSLPPGVSKELEAEWQRAYEGTTAYQAERAMVAVRAIRAEASKTWIGRLLMRVTLWVVMTADRIAQWITK